MHPSAYRIWGQKVVLYVQANAKKHHAVSLVFTVANFWPMSQVVK